jgi:hypothetical protein
MPIGPLGWLKRSGGLLERSRGQEMPSGCYGMVSSIIYSLLKNLAAVRATRSLEEGMADPDLHEEVRECIGGRYYPAAATREMHRGLPD